MTASAPGDEVAARRGRFANSWQAEALGIAVLAALAAYFLAISWRKWPDPIVDSGPQLYAIWRVSDGAKLYHDFLWNYGPLSVCFNAALFKIFGPGLMVLAMANLIFYAAIVSLAYLAFRKAWGRLGAFAALAVFISVFSFSHLLAVGNYNFVTPYAAEATHGTLLVLATVFIVARWQRQTSRWFAFLLGLCGGLAAVMKPEFMLATGLLGIAALFLRWRQRRRVSAAEFALIVAGIVLPTGLFTVWFARVESLKDAFIDASQAWWLVVVSHIQRGNVQQLKFSGLDNPWANALAEIKYATLAALVLGAVWAAGWLVNRSWSGLVRVVAALAALVLATFVRWNGGWFEVGRCLPGLLAVAFIILAVRLALELREKKEASEMTVMAFLLVLLAAAMLARMPLLARVSHLGFFQAALAAMVIAAMMVSELPRWTGAGVGGRWVTAAGCLVFLALGCSSIAARSRAIRADQTEVVGRGADRFYSTQRMIDGTGALVNWVSERLRSAPPEQTVMVLPEGAMINYLSRHKSPEPGWERGEEAKYVEQLRRAPPEYVVLISRELKEFGITRYGAPGSPGFVVIQWVGTSYVAEAQLGGDPLDPNAPVGAVILRRKPTEKNEAEKAVPDAPNTPKQ